MSSSYIRVGPTATDQYASLTVNVDPLTGQPVSGGGGGGTSDPAIASNLEEIKTDLRNRLPIPIAFVQRENHDAQQYQVSALTIGANPDRKRLRINNNIGDGYTQPPRGIAYLFVGHDFDPDRTKFDQVVRPGESILVDAPTLSIAIRSDSIDPMYGSFTVVEYY
jgi:hypothetical protein